jgi:hypothetical protein
MIKILLQEGKCLISKKMSLKHKWSNEINQFFYSVIKLLTKNGIKQQKVNME